MPNNDNHRCDRSFSVELYSKNQLKSMSIANQGKLQSTLIEGTIGGLVEASLTEDIVLEVRGTKGILRMGLQMCELVQSKISAGKNI